MRASVFIATSLDGYIARRDGSIDWLMAANARVPAGEDCGYKVFFESVDVLVMGRKTFELVLTFEAWPYGDTRVVVLSSRDLVLPTSVPDSVEVSSQPPELLVQRLEQEGARHLYVDGGVTIQRFLAAGLIDDVTLTLIPVLLGEGRTLFGPLEQDVHLVLQGVRHWDFGFAQLSYAVTRPAR